MAKRKPPASQRRASEATDAAKELSGLQAAIMRVLWERGEATVAEVQEALEDSRPLAHNTVATVLVRLAGEGVVTARKDGRSYVYRPMLERSQARRSMVGSLVRRLFGGQPAALASHLVRESELGSEDLDELEALIRERRRAMQKQSRKS